MLTRHYLSPFVNLWEIIGLQCCKYYHFPSHLWSKFQSSMTIFHHKLLTNRWTNSFITRANISSLIVHPHLLVRATSERRIPTLVASSGSHLAKPTLKLAPTGTHCSLVARTSKCRFAIIHKKHHPRSYHSDIKIPYDPKYHIISYTLQSFGVSWHRFG